jgi:hypothetical protein
VDVAVDHLASLLLMRSLSERYNHWVT